MNICICIFFIHILSSVYHKYDTSPFCQRKHTLTGQNLVGIKFFLGASNAWNDRKSVLYFSYISLEQQCLLFSILLIITVSYLNDTASVIDNEISTWNIGVIILLFCQP